MTSDRYPLAGFIRRIIARPIQLSKGKAARDFYLTVGSNIGIVVFSAVGGILAARLLGVSGRGELAAATVWASVLGVVATLGLPQALTYFVAREPAELGDIFFTTLVLLSIQSVIILFVGLLASEVLLTQATPATVTTVRIFLCSIPFSLLTTFLSTMAQGLKRFRMFNLFRLSPALCYAVVFIIAYALGLKQAREVVVLLLAFQIVIATAILVTFWIRIRPRGNFSPRQSRRLLRYGLKSYWGSLAWMGNARLDQFVMTAFLGLRELGQYAVAVSYATALFPISGAFAMVMFPRVASSDHFNAKRTIKLALASNLAISCAGALVLGILCPVLLPWLFGTEYQASIYPALVLLGGSILLGCNYVLSDGLRGIGFPLVTSIAELVGIAVTGVGLYLFLPRFGIAGAAKISVISYGTVLLILGVGLKFAWHRA